MQPDTVADVAEKWLRRHAEAKKLRTAAERKRVIERYVLPHMAAVLFAGIKRSDIAELLDAIEDRNGAWVADSALAALRALASWFASRNDDYTPPFAAGMRRVAKDARHA